MKEQPKPVGLILCLYNTGRGFTDIAVKCCNENLDGLPAVRLSGSDSVKLGKDAVAVETSKLGFDPQYILTCGGDVWFPAGHVSKAVRILEDNADVGVVAGLAVDSLRAFNGPAASTTHRITDWLSRFAYEKGELIYLRHWCYNWALIRRDLLCRLKNLGGPLRMNAEIHRTGMKAVTERTLLVGRVDAEAGVCYFPNYPPVAIAGGIKAPVTLTEHAVVGVR